MSLSTKNFKCLFYNGCVSQKLQYINILLTRYIYLVLTLKRKLADNVECNFVLIIDEFELRAFNDVTAFCKVT